jgi:hypothetical protein
MINAADAQHIIKPESINVSDVSAVIAEIQLIPDNNTSNKLNTFFIYQLN